MQVWELYIRVLATLMKKHVKAEIYSMATARAHVPSRLSFITQVLSVELGWCLGGIPPSPTFQAPA